VIVQITKEGVGTKGPTLSSYLSIPGRFLVMMPGMSRHGVSRKIEDEAARRQMRDVLNELKLPTDMGFILRTAGLDRSKRELQRDLNYLLRLWKTVVERIKSQPAPAELYRESDLVTRTIRDVYSTEFVRLIVDDPATAQQVREFLQIAMPRTKTAVELYTEREPLFHRMGIEAEIERINLRHVPLKSGGSLVVWLDQQQTTILGQRVASDGSLVGGAITINVPIDVETGHIAPDTLAQVARLGKHLKSRQAATPSP
jgi:ribonuclease E